MKFTLFSWWKATMFFQRALASPSSVCHPFSMCILSLCLGGAMPWCWASRNWGMQPAAQCLARGALSSVQVARPKGLGAQVVTQGRVGRPCGRCRG